VIAPPSSVEGDHERVMLDEVFPVIDRPRGMVGAGAATVIVEEDIVLFGGLIREITGGVVSGGGTIGTGVGAGATYWGAGAPPSPSPPL
jgi:hypothetical protein